MLIMHCVTFILLILVIKLYCFYNIPVYCSVETINYSITVSHNIILNYASSDLLLYWCVQSPNRPYSHYKKDCFLTVRLSTFDSSISSGTSPIYITQLSLTTVFHNFRIVLLADFTRVAFKPLGPTSPKVAPSTLRSFSLLYTE